MLSRIVGGRSTQESRKVPIALRVASVGRLSPLSEIAASLGYRLGFNFLRDSNVLPLSSPMSINRLSVGGNIDTRRLRTSICFPGLFAE